MIHDASTKPCTDCSLFAGKDVFGFDILFPSDILFTKRQKRISVAELFVYSVEKLYYYSKVAKKNNATKNVIVKLDSKDADEEILRQPTQNPN